MAAVVLGRCGLHEDAVRTMRLAATRTSLPTNSWASHARRTDAVQQSTRPRCDLNFCFQRAGSDLSWQMRVAKSRSRWRVGAARHLLQALRVCLLQLVSFCRRQQPGHCCFAAALIAAARGCSMPWVRACAQRWSRTTSPCPPVLQNPGARRRSPARRKIAPAGNSAETGNGR